MVINKSHIYGLQIWIIVPRLSGDWVQYWKLSTKITRQKNAFILVTRRPWTPSSMGKYVHSSLMNLVQTQLFKCLLVYWCHYVLNSYPEIYKYVFSKTYMSKSWRYWQIEYEISYWEERKLSNIKYCAQSLNWEEIIKYHTDV